MIIIINYMYINSRLIITVAWELLNVLGQSAVYDKLVASEADLSHGYNCKILVFQIIFLNSFDNYILKIHSFTLGDNTP
jgi:hypothetical protein